MPNRRAPDQKLAGAHVPADLHAAAAEKAKREGRTLSDVIREALRRYVGGD